MPAAARMSFVWPSSYRSPLSAIVLAFRPRLDSPRAVFLIQHASSRSRPAASSASLGLPKHFVQPQNFPLAKPFVVYQTRLMQHAPATTPAESLSLTSRALPAAFARFDLAMSCNIPRPSFYLYTTSGKTVTTKEFFVVRSPRHRLTFTKIRKTQSVLPIMKLA